MKTVADVLAAYPSKSNMAAIAYKIPVDKLEEVQAIFRNEKVKVNYFFRGPRAHNNQQVITNGNGDTFMRRRCNSQSTCLKQDAVYFSVYAKSERNW